MDYTEEIKFLAKGEDFLARATICQRLQHIIDQSELGEIGLADFTAQLLSITADCKMLNEQPWDIKHNKDMKKRYNVYIVHIKTRKADAQIGENLTEERAERRVMTGLSRINSEYFVDDVEVGSGQDKKYQADIKSNVIN